MSESTFLLYLLVDIFCVMLSENNQGRLSHERQMALTGDLEHLHIVDIIQLIHTTRKSGTFSVTGSKGESRIIFSNGYIVGASHLNNSVRIGTVLVKMNLITTEELREALHLQKNAGKERKPLLATLMKMGRLDIEAASRGLKKLIEITIVELIGWTRGTFTFDSESIAVSTECTYIPGKMEQEMTLDAQMVLMDALRIFDERERDRQSEKHIPSYEELYADVMPSENTTDHAEKNPVITADDLGLGDLDQLENKIPQSLPREEDFQPAAIHRQKIRETLSEYSTEEQETFVSFLESSSARRSISDGSLRQEDLTRALVLFSKDELIKHSVMTVCKNENILVFATDTEEELDRIMAQCLSIQVLPLLIIDNPGNSAGDLSEQMIVSLRRQVQEKYSFITMFQLASPRDYTFSLQSYRDGIRAVLPKPVKEMQGKTYIDDTIVFLETFKSTVSSFLSRQNDLSVMQVRLKKLKEQIGIIRGLDAPSSVSLAFLRSVAQMFERSITFIVRPNELLGERAIGINADKNMEPALADTLKIPLTKPSVFRTVVQTGQVFYGEGADEVVKQYLFNMIGAPQVPTIILLPLMVRGKIMTLTYGDFGKQEVSPVQIDTLEILANHTGQAMEYALYRKNISKKDKPAQKEKTV